MKILFYSLNYAPELTATGKYTGDMAEWLAAQGHDVSVIAGMPHYPQWQLSEGYSRNWYMRETLSGVEVLRVPHYIPEKSRVTGKARMRMDMSFLMWSLRYWIVMMFARGRYDVVITVCPPFFTSIMPMLYRFLRNVPWMLHVQDIQIDVAVRVGLIKNGYLIRLLYALEKMILRRAVFITTISGSMRQLLSGKLGDASKIGMLRNWADPKVLSHRLAPGAFREKNAIPMHKFVVLYSGNLGEKQGVEIVFDIAGRMRSNTDIQFVVAGDGAAKDRLEKLADEKALTNILLLPLQEKNMLPAMLHDADLHLVIQKDAASGVTLPSKLSNILASGRPCVVTAHEHTELAEIVNTGRLGIAAAPDDVEGIVHAIERLARDSDEAALMGKNAESYARRHLDRDSILSHFELELNALPGMG